MQKIEQKISPAGFARLQVKMLEAEAQGHGPDAAAAMGLTSIGLYPSEDREIVFVVDPALDGPIYPFMDWPKGWVKDDPETWR